MPLETVRFGRSRVVHALLGDGVAVVRWPTLCDRDTFECRDVAYFDAGTEPVTCRRCLARLTASAQERPQPTNRHIPAITISPLQQWGEACVDGTRMTVAALVAFVERYGREAVKHDYRMTDDQIDVALWFAAAYRLRRRRAFREALNACPVYRRAWKLDEEQG